MELDSILEKLPATAVARDVKLNLKRLCEESSLTPVEAALALLATSTSTGHKELQAYARDWGARLDLTREALQEAAESAGIMGMLNTYYRFRHLLREGAGAEADHRYTAAGLRMTALAKPLLGKERFEMLAFAVSVLNGCGQCIVAHEKTLLESGVEVNKVHDLARLAAVVKGLSDLEKSFS